MQRLVMPCDMNPGKKLFGGKLMAWLDEAGALFVMDKLGTQNVVTKKVSEITFDQPVNCGDYLIFECDIPKYGKTSINVSVIVYKNI